MFITQSYFKVPKHVRLYTTHFFIAKIQKKRELQQIAIDHSSDVNTKDFGNIYREYTAKPFSFFVIDTTITSNNPLKFRKKIFGIKCKFSWMQFHCIKSWQLTIRLKMKTTIRY